LPALSRSGSENYRGECREDATFRVVPIDESCWNDVAPEDLASKIVRFCGTADDVSRIQPSTFAHPSNVSLVVFVHWAPMPELLRGGPANSLRFGVGHEETRLSKLRTAVVPLRSWAFKRRRVAGWRRRSQNRVCHSFRTCRAGQAGRGGMSSGATTR